MQPLRAGLAPAARNGNRIVVKDLGARDITLEQPHAAAVEQVNRGVEGQAGHSGASEECVWELVGRGPDPGRGRGVTSHQRR